MRTWRAEEVKRTSDSTITDGEGSGATHDPVLPHTFDRDSVCTVPDPLEFCLVPVQNFIVIATL